MTAPGRTTLALLVVLMATGVGLFMSKTIIEKNMGGSLTALNTADGAEFRIEV